MKRKNQPSKAWSWSCWPSNRLPTALRPFGIACLLATPIALLAASLQPGLTVGATGVAGIAAGFVGTVHRRFLFAAWGARGIRLPRELESATLLALGVSLALAGSFLIVIEQWSPSSWIPTGVLTATYLGFAVLWWRQSPIAKPSPIPGSPIDVPWVPGYALDEERRQPADARSVTIRYEVPEENRDAFREAMIALKEVRQREGALQWRLSQDVENPERFTESYLLESWADYQATLRHETEADRETKQRVFNLNDWDSLPLESHEALEES